MKTLNGHPAPDGRLTAPLTHPAYQQRAWLRGWTGKVSSVSLACPRAAANLIKRLAPHWSQEDHLQLANHHAQRARKLRAVWSLVADRAAIELLGRPFLITDYRVCAIGLPAFAEHHKRVLRHCAYNETKHLKLAMAHAHAAGKRKFAA